MRKTLEFTDQELNILLLALQKQPYETVAELIKNIIMQLQPKVEEVKDNK